MYTKHCLTEMTEKAGVVITTGTKTSATEPKIWNSEINQLVKYKSVCAIGIWPLIRVTAANEPCNKELDRTLNNTYWKQRHCEGNPKASNEGIRNTAKTLGNNLNYYMEG